jgi:putative ATPase
LALAPKSNALYQGFAACTSEVRNGFNPPVPLHLRNAPTKLMHQLGYGKGYRYAHDTAEGLTDMECLPEGLAGRSFYQPTQRGYEAQLAQRMEKIAAWRRRRAAQQGDRRKGQE